MAKLNRIFSRLRRRMTEAHHRRLFHRWRDEREARRGGECRSPSPPP